MELRETEAELQEIPVEKSENQPAFAPLAEILLKTEN
jgi:hypothetical protein